MKKYSSFITILLPLAIAAKLLGEALARLESFARAASGLTGNAPASADVATRRVVPTARAPSWAPPRASATEHMTRIAAVIHALAARCRFAENCHAAAAMQIDAALYDIERLRADLEASIGLSLAVSGLLPVTSRAELQPVTASSVPRPSRARIMAGQSPRALSAA